MDAFMNIVTNVALLADLGKILAVVFHGALVLWTYKDAMRRVEDPILVATAVATALVLPIMGVLLYMLVRPPEYLADVRERELEIRAMQRQIGNQERCPSCRSHIESDYLACPICRTQLRQPCRRCDKPLDPRWAVCPYCETEAPRPTSRDMDSPPARRARPVEPNEYDVEDDAPPVRKRPRTSPRESRTATEPIAPPAADAKKRRSTPVEGGGTGRPREGGGKRVDGKGADRTKSSRDSKDRSEDDQATMAFTPVGTPGKD